MSPGSRLKELPAVHALVDAAARHTSAPRWAVVAAAQRAISHRRADILADATVAADIAAEDVARLAEQLALPSLRKVLNGTGVVLHTNLGRAPLAEAAVSAVVEVASGYSNLEFDVVRGVRGSRHVHVASLIAELTGAAAGVVVNNNAAATVLALATLAAGREVIVSRGELVEIGGAFRVPDILKISGATLVEVGTTNKTRLSDYANAITANTALLLKVHRSNFAMIGFTEEVDASALATLARERGLASMLDLGSGALIAQEAQRAMGLPAEATVQQSIDSGMDVVCFSGDKLLGGPQAGILVGAADVIERMRTHPLMRALRPDKMTIAALAATLSLYRDGRSAEVPTIAALAMSCDELAARAQRLCAALDAATADEAIVIEPIECRSTVGGGTMPTSSIPSFGIAIAARGRTADQIAAALRGVGTAVTSRIENDRVVIDLRTITVAEEDLLFLSLLEVLGSPRH